MQKIEPKKPKEEQVKWKPISGEQMSRYKKIFENKKWNKNALQAGFAAD
jgi:hypothetical protein